MIVDIVDKYLTDDNNPIKNLRLKRVVQDKSSCRTERHAGQVVTQDRSSCRTCRHTGQAVMQDRSALYFLSKRIWHRDRFFDFFFHLFGIVPYTIAKTFSILVSYFAEVFVIKN
jgi:hypothetical protein